MSINKLSLLNDKNIRSAVHDDELWYVVNDIIIFLAGNKNPKEFIQRMKKRDAGLNKRWNEIVILKEIRTRGGRQMLKCVNAIGFFRLIQSVPTINVEPTKSWIAEAAYEQFTGIRTSAKKPATKKK